ncbi:MAG: hypothetical protein FJ027_06455 [Candidatus Rokubacteria bacterium]|nr:hypothetical protein [Candidatus Rokubacteria bacterium]
MFQRLAVGEMTSLGITGMPLLLVDHPLGGERAEGVSRRAVQAVEQLTGLIGHQA